MPIKRSPEEGSRPPLSRGSACHRCFARKVRCSGQPASETGLNACTSCLRTARFKGHDLAHARCAFQGEGLCSEEGGPSMTGEIYSNVGPAPRRKLTSRSSTNTSVSSTRSAASAVSNATDYSFDSVGAASLISPVSSTGSLKSMGDGGPSASSSPETLQLAPPATYQLPPALPPYAIPGVTHHEQQQPPPPPQPYYAPQPSTSTLPPTSFPPHAPFPGTYRTASDPSCAKSLLSRRTKASPMSIALPPQPSMIPSPTVSRGTSPVNPASAPLAMPQNWGPPAHQHHHQQPHQHQQQPHRQLHHQPQPLPLQHHQPQHQHQPSQQHAYATQYAQQDDLAGAMQSVLTPSTLSKLPGAHSSSYDFPLPSEAYAAYGGAPTPALGYGGAMHLGGYGAPSGMSGAALPPTPLRSLSVSELYPPSSYAQAAPPPPQASTAGVEYDVHAPVAWSTSFHLPSPGVTFTSSTPHWLAHGGGAAASQYFQV